MSAVILNGITWGHTRGLTPLLAAAQRYSELFPDVEIRWRKRTLQEFADVPINKLAQDFDLLIIDHPWVGFAAATKCLLPLDEYLPSEFLDDQEQNSVGPSHQSYFYDNHQWALAIDAATLATSYRADLFESNRVSVPDTWDDVLLLARSGRVIISGLPVDSLMAFYMFCIANGEEPFLNKNEVIPKLTGLKALETMLELWSLCDPLIFKSNPIAIAELMSQTNNFWYCPFAYCYSNYSRRGYAKHLLTYKDLSVFGNTGRLRSTIGGTGLAISAFTEHKTTAVDFAKWINSGICQSTFYVENGGQPGRSEGWTSKVSNLLCNDFFIRILPTMERGYMRPRYNGYLNFQDHAGDVLFDYLKHGGSPDDVLGSMNSIYVKSLTNE